MRSSFKAFIVGAMSVALAACGSSSAPPARTAAQLDDGTYYAGMLLYSNEVSHLTNGAVIGYRLTDSDGSSVVERIGVMTVDSVDANGISLSWHTYDTDKKSAKASGSFTLTTDGDGGDLDNDGELDVHYISSPTPRDGLTDERYLKFAFHRSTQRAKQISFRIVDNGTSAPALASRAILQFAHDGSMLLHDRKLTVVTKYANNQVSYGDDPSLYLLRKDDYLLIDQRLSLAEAQAQADITNNAFSASTTLTKDGLGGQPNALCCGLDWINDHIIHPITKVAEVTYTDAKGEIVHIAKTAYDDAESEWDKISAFWQRYTNIKYSGAPLTISNVPFRQGNVGRVKDEGIYNATLDDGLITFSGQIDLIIEYEIAISLDPISFAEGALTGHPSFSLFSVNSQWFPTIYPTVNFNNMTDPYSKEFHIPLSPAIPIEDTPFTITPAMLGVKFECVPGSEPIDGNVNFYADGVLNLDFDQGSLSGSGTVSLSLLSQNAFTAANASYCAIGMGPAAELSAAELVHLPVTNWFMYEFTAVGMQPVNQITAGLTVGFEGVTIWDIGEETLYSFDYPLIAY